jgi:hypothetical protein
MLASVHIFVLSLVVHFVFLALCFIIPISAHRLAANISHFPLHPFSSISYQSSSELGLTHSHTYSLTVLGVASLVFYLSARTLRHTVSVSPTKKLARARALAEDDTKNNYILSEVRLSLSLLFGRDVSAADAYIAETDGQNQYFSPSHIAV